MRQRYPNPRLLPTDTVVLILNAVFGGLYLAFRLLAHEDALGPAAFYVAAVPGVLLLVRALGRSRHPFLQFLRTFYVQLFYIFYFTDCIRLSQLVYGGRSLDWLFLRIDEALFGFQPAIRLPELLSGYPAVNELFFMSYFFYYALIVVGPWVLFFRGHRRAAVRGLFLITAGFAVLYLFYILFPVHGPKYAIASLRERWYTEFSGYLFTSLMKTIFNNTNLAGAAFPSSHVAMATAALLFNRRHVPRLAAAFVVPTLLLFVSTVYIYAHYAVDVLAGIPVGIAIYFAVPRFWPALRKVTVRLDRLLPALGP